MSAAALLAGYGADLAIGDPRRGHPVAAFGAAAERLERVLHGPSRARGALFAVLLVGGAAALAELAARIAGRGRTLAVVTWAALGGRSLVTTGREIAAVLETGDLEGARRRLPALVGRDPAGLDDTEISRAVVESLAENTSDAVVAALLWGAIAGAPGVAAFRAANTLDAMVGHRTPRHEAFGWASARLDDAMGWPAATLSIGLTALCAPMVGGSPRVALRAARRDGPRHPSPNAGRVEAGFAGALGVRLGGPLSYGGRAEHRPLLGTGRPPAVGDVERAARLSVAVGACAALVCGAARSLRRRGR